MIQKPASEEPRMTACLSVCGAVCGGRNQAEDHGRVNGATVRASRRLGPLSPSACRSSLIRLGMQRLSVIGYRYYGTTVRARVRVPSRIPHAPYLYGHHWEGVKRCMQWPSSGAMGVE